MHSHRIVEDFREGYDILVLILVLMEDALAQIPVHMIGVIYVSLNPCFNGRCTRTYKWWLGVQITQVLILVLMEDALAQKYLVQYR
mgnify:CR=1 FL=1